MEELKYYISDGKERSGPFSLNQLEKKVTSRETYIWYEGLDSWELISEINELEYLISKIPPSVDSIKHNPPKKKELTPLEIESRLLKKIESTPQYRELKSKISGLDRDFFNSFENTYLSGKLVDRFYESIEENKSNILKLYLQYSNEGVSNFNSAVSHILKREENLVYLKINSQVQDSLDDLILEIEKITSKKFILDLDKGQGALVDFFIAFDEEAKPILIKLYQIYGQEGRINFKNAISKIYKYDKSFNTSSEPKIKQPSKQKKLDVIEIKQSKCLKCGSLLNDKEECSSCEIDKKKSIKENVTLSNHSKIRASKTDSYKPIKTTLIILVIIDLIIESAISSTNGKIASIPAVLITYIIANAIMKHLHSKDSNFSNKIVTTVLVFFGVIIAKGILLYLFLSAIL